LLTRCSRPLYSSQETTPHPPQRSTEPHDRGDQPHTPTPSLAANGKKRVRGCVQPHNPIACLHHTPTPPPFHPPRRSTRQSRIADAVPIHRCSTLEQPPA
jgi:hypothetical protein